MVRLATARAQIELTLSRFAGRCDHAVEPINKHAQRLQDLPSMRRFAEVREASAPFPHLRDIRAGMPIYHIAPAEPHPATSLISADAKAVALALGGTGTGRSGVGMMRLAGSVRELGIDLVSTDHPFHGYGIRSLQAVAPEFYFARLNAVLDELASTGLPLFLLGHSFGSIVIQELLARNNRALAGAIMMSPAGFQSPGLLAHYVKFRNSPAWDAFTAEHAIAWDRVAEVWGEGWRGDGGIGGLFTSVAHTGPIPTSTPVLLVAGREDPWSTEALVGELAARFSRSRTVMVDGAGHTQVLTVKDRNKTFITQLFAEFAAEHGVQLFTNARAGKNIATLIALHQRSALCREWVETRGMPYSEIVADERKAKAVAKAWNQYFSSEFVPHVARERFASEARYIAALRAGATNNPIEASRWSGRSKFSFRTSFHIEVDGRSLSECDALTRERILLAAQEVERILQKDPTTLSQGEAALLERYADKGLEVPIASNQRVSVTMREQTDLVSGY